MYFVTDEPKLFNAETGNTFFIDASLNSFQVMGSQNRSIVYFDGTLQECEDFIYSIAGYVGAVNPIAKVAE